MIESCSRPYLLRLQQRSRKTLPTAYLAVCCLARVVWTPSQKRRAECFLHSVATMLLTRRRELHRQFRRNTPHESIGNTTQDASTVASVLGMESTLGLLTRNDMNSIN